MIRISKWIVPSACLVIACVADARCQTPPLSEDQPDAPAEILFEGIADLRRSEDSGEYVATVNLGRLPVGQSVQVRLTMKNDSDDEIVFAGVSGNCSCTSFNSEQNKILPRGETAATWSIRTPSRNTSLVTSNTLMLQYAGKVVIRITLQFELGGLLMFGEVAGVLTFDSDDATKSIEIPFIVSPPVQADRVNITFSPELQQLERQITIHEGGGIITLTAADSVASTGPIRGQVFLSYPDAQFNDVFLLSIKDGRRHEISPRLIRFRPLGDTLVATALVRLADTADAESENSVSVECSLNGESLIVEAKRLTSKMYRVRLSMQPEEKTVSTSRNRDDEAIEPLALVWKIQNGKTTSRMETPCAIDNTGSTTDSN